MDKEPKQDELLREGTAPGPEEGSETQESADSIPREESPEESPASRLAACIRTCSVGSHVMPFKKLKLSPPNGVTPEETAALLLAVGTAQADPALSKVSFIKGEKDLYFFDHEVMTPHFAELESLLEDKNILRTIATVTRSDCKLYPRPTQFSKLMTYPFYFSMDEILGAAARMAMSEEYSDIDVVEATNGAKGFYSAQFMSKRYAQALIQQVEVEEEENP